MGRSRRDILTLGAVAIASAAVGCGAGWVAHSPWQQSEALPTAIKNLPAQAPPPPIARCAALVHPEKQWWWTELNNFLEYLPVAETLELQKSVDVLPPNATVSNLSPTHSQDVYKFLSELDYVSDSTWDYMGEDAYEGMWQIDYHNRVKWLAKKFGVADSDMPEEASTFHLEHSIYNKAFELLWDKLPVDQRMALLQKVDPQGQIPYSDKAAIAAMSGASALAALDVTVAFSGFAFYTTMSTVLASVAGFFGITLPFAAYTGASSTIAILTGPWGLAIAAALAGVGAVPWIGTKVRASVPRTFPAVVQLHSLKVAALHAAGQGIPS